MTEASAPVFDVQTLATRDGQGLRTLVFLQGCPLRCTWCSNPEGQASGPQLRWRRAATWPAGRPAGTAPSALFGPKTPAGRMQSPFSTAMYARIATIMPVSRNALRGRSFYRAGA
jgi:pyruvate-formate lyase-activating enzyme